MPASAATVSSESPIRLADVAHGRTRPIVNDRGGKPGAIAAVTRVDVLDDLLAALVLEIDVDIGRFAARSGDMKRSNSRSISVGFTAVMLRQ